jgi:hypothetical protein
VGVHGKYLKKKIIQRFLINSGCDRDIVHSLFGSVFICVVDLKNKTFLDAFFKKSSKNRDFVPNYIINNAGVLLPSSWFTTLDKLTVQQGPLLIYSLIREFSRFIFLLNILKKKC